MKIYENLKEKAFKAVSGVEYFNFTTDIRMVNISK